MFRKNYSNTFLTFVLALLIFQSCVDKEPDVPPIDLGSDPEIAVDKIMTTSDLLDLWNPGEIVQINDDKYLKVVVVGDDESGTFFKSLVLQEEDGSAGITIILDEVDMYRKYPIGRRVFVKLDGLYLADFAGLPQLGSAPVDDEVQRIPDALVEEVILPGILGVAITPKPRTIGDLSTADLNTLVELTDVEFLEVGQPYADGISDPPQSLNRTLRNCNGGNIIVRNSGFSTFANDIMPTGNGKLIGLMGRFVNDDQLLIRNPEHDLDMTGIRCDGTGGEPCDMLEDGKVDIATLRCLYSRGEVAITTESTVEGVVISDRQNGNTNGNNIVVQGETGGIVLRFIEPHSFNVGTSISVDITGQTMSDFNGLLQIADLSANLATDMGTTDLPEPMETTISDILDNAEAWESTRVLIKGAQFSGGSSYAGSLTVTDNSGSISMFTLNSASFANAPVPSGNVDITAIVSDFNNPQIFITASSDVVGGTTGGGDCDDLEDGQVSVELLRCRFGEGNASITTNSFIEGVVISDVNGGNINNQNLQIQDGEFGITVRFTEPHTYALGEILRVDLQGVSMSEFNALLQLNNLELSDATVIGTGSVSPRQATIQQVLDNAEAWESTLVEIMDVSITGENATYNGNTTLDDGTGSIGMFTRSGADYADDPLPNGTVNVTAIVSQFNDYQLALRNGNDIQ